MEKIGENKIGCLVVRCHEQDILVGPKNFYLPVEKEIIINIG